MRYYRFSSKLILIMWILLSAAPSHLSNAKVPPPFQTIENLSVQPLILVWQSEYTPDAELITPVDIAVDDQGSVYVTTAASKPIKKFNNQGKLETQWGTTGDKAGQFIIAAGIALDSHGNVYVGDFATTRIEKFDKDGKFLMQWDTEPPRGPGGIGVDQAGNVYVANFSEHEHQMQKFDNTGKLLHQWASTGNGEGQLGATEMAGPEDLALDADANQYVADKLNHRIQKYDSNGKLIATIGGKLSKAGNGEFYDPRGVDVDAHGNIYVLDTYFLQKLDPQGKPIAQWSNEKGGAIDRAGLMTVDWQGNIYVNAIAKVTSARGTQEEVFVVKKFKQP
jgi:tripartite motif-containing protein 71